MMGQAAVAEVIRNRAADPRWPNSITAVCVQPWQFSAFNVGDPNERKWPDPHSDSWKSSVAAMDMALSEDGGSQFAKGANHYFRALPGVHPAWAEGKEPVVVLGHHRFYKL